MAKIKIIIMSLDTDGGAKMKKTMLTIAIMTVMAMMLFGCDGEEAYYEDDGSSAAYEDDYDDYGGSVDNDAYATEDSYDGYDSYDDYDACAAEDDYDDDYLDEDLYDDDCDDSYDDFDACAAEDDYDDDYCDEDLYEDDDICDDYAAEEDCDDDYWDEDLYDDYDACEDVEDEVIESAQNDEWVSIFDLTSAQGYLGTQIHTTSELCSPYDEQGNSHPYGISVHPDESTGWGGPPDIEFYNTDYDSLKLSFYPKKRTDEHTSRSCHFEVTASDTGTLIYSSPELRYGDYGEEVTLDISQYHNQRIKISPKMAGSGNAIIYILTDGIFVK